MILVFFNLLASYNYFLTKGSPKTLPNKTALSS